MVRDVAVKLISETFTFDDIGNQLATESENSVFATIESISQSEFFSAGQSGFKPDYKVVIWGFEHTNEGIVELDSVRYSVYRTFLRKDEKIELYLSKKVGV